MGTQPLPQKGRNPPIFGPRLLWPNGCMDQDATWYGGRPREAYATLCSMWTQLLQEKRADPPHPIFGPCLLWPNGWMDEDAAWYGNRPRFRPHCIRRGSQLRRKGHSSPPLFGPCLLWPRSPISATGELLFSICHCLVLSSLCCCTHVLTFSL